MQQIRVSRKLCLGETSRATPQMPTQQCLGQASVPPPQSPPLDENFLDEDLEPPPHSFEFTSLQQQQSQPQQHLRYSPHTFGVSGDDFMTNLIGTNLRTPESAYAYMQSISIPSFASFHQAVAGRSSTPVVDNFMNYQPVAGTNLNENPNEVMQDDQPVVHEVQVEPQQHPRIRRNPRRNRQPPRCGTGGHKGH